MGIATRSIAATTEFYKSLGLEIESIEVVGDQNVRVAIMRVGDSAIELMEPIGDNSPINRFLRRRGEGLHHITLEVSNLEVKLEVLKKKNIQLIDEKPRQGAEGSRIAFIHPDSAGGILIELLERAPEEIV